MRTPRIAPLIVALALAIAAGCAREPAAEPAGGVDGADARPDLVLIVVDTLRADHMSLYDYHRPTTPRLVELAAAGVVFEDATSQSSWTRPSMVSMLTGRRVFVNANRVPDSVPTLAERLAGAGYETAAFVANPAVSAGEGFARGFDTWITRDDTGGQTWDAEDLEAAVEDWLSRARPTDAPRFVYLHYLDPHDPYAPRGPPPLAGEPELRDDVIEAWTRATTDAGEGSPIWQHFDRDRREILASLDAYDKEIVNVDASIERVLAALGEARAGTREPLVVLTSDHGEGLWNHRHHPNLIAELSEEERTLARTFWRDHSYHLYREFIHVPLAAWGPGLPSGARVDVPVENVDIVPTLLRAAEVEVEEPLDGLALQDVAAGTARARPFVFSHCNEATSVRRVDSTYKLIFPTATGDHFGMHAMLFRLGDDPHERRDLSPYGETDRSSAAPHLDVLRELLRVREDAAEAFSLYAEGESHDSMDPESREVLLELGYIQER